MAEERRPQVKAGDQRSTLRYRLAALQVSRGLNTGAFNSEHHDD